MFAPGAKALYGRPKRTMAGHCPRSASSTACRPSRSPSRKQPFCRSTASAQALRPSSRVRPRRSATSIIGSAPTSNPRVRSSTGRRSRASSSWNAVRSAYGSPCVIGQTQACTVFS